MVMVPIRNVPEDLHRRLKARAAMAGLSLSGLALSDLASADITLHDPTPR